MLCKRHRTLYYTRCLVRIDLAEKGVLLPLSSLLSYFYPT